MTAADEIRTMRDAEDAALAALDARDYLVMRGHIDRRDVTTVLDAAGFPALLSRVSELEEENATLRASALESAKAEAFDLYAPKVVAELMAEAEAEKADLHRRATVACTCGMGWPR